MDCKRIFNYLPAPSIIKFIAQTFPARTKLSWLSTQFSTNIFNKIERLQRKNSLIQNLSEAVWQYFLSFTGHLLFSFNRGIVPTKNETINVGSSGVIAFSPFSPTRHEPCPCFMTPGLLSAHEFHLNMEFCLLNLFLRPYMQCYCEKRPCLNQEVNRCACSISCDLKPRILPSFRAILRYFFCI